MISQRAWLIGGIGFCFYLIAIVNTLPSFYYALTWLAVGVLASSLAIALLSLIGLRCKWRTPDAVVAQSHEDGASGELVGPVVEAEFANAGTLNKTGVLVEVALRRSKSTFGQAGREEKSKNDVVLKRRYLLEALPSGQSVTTELPLTNLPRGRWRVEELKLIGSDVLGLFHIQKRIAAGNEKSGEIVVGPIALPPPEGAEIPFAPSRGDAGIPATRFLGQGDEIRGTRLYTAGDDLRHVHWKSTARKGQLVVKEFHHTLQSRTLVIWDGAAQTKWGEGESTFNSLEWSLCVAASLCRIMEERYQPCSLWRLDSAPIQIGQQSNDMRSANGPLSNAALTMTQVAKALADAQADRTVPLHQAMGAASMRDASGKIESGGVVYLVTASLAPDVPRAVRQLRAAGATVSVALINSVAFAPEKRSRFNVQGAQQSWQAGSGMEAGAVLLTSEAFEEQANTLRTLGARVVTVAPDGGSRSLQPLRVAMHLLLHEGSATTASALERAEPQEATTVGAM